GPHRDRLERLARRQDGGHRRLGLGIQALRGDGGDNLVTLRPPAEERLDDQKIRHRKSGEGGAGAHDPQYRKTGLPRGAAEQRWRGWPARRPNGGRRGAPRRNGPEAGMMGKAGRGAEDSGREGRRRKRPEFRSIKSALQMMSLPDRI